MFASSLYGYKMMNSPKVGTEITYLIPIIFSNEYLSEQGKKYRKYFFIYLIGFFVWSFSIEWFDMYVMN